MKALVSIFIGTYARYNNGDNGGEWIELPQSEKKIREALHRVAKRERDPEFMILDTEITGDIDFRAIGESENIFALNKEISKLKLKEKIRTLKPEIAEAAAEYAKLWQKHDMYEFCVNRISDVYKTQNGDLIIFNKPEIRTKFCFGHGQNGITTDSEYEAASKTAHDAATKDFFISENLDRAFGRPESLLKAKKLIGLRSYGTETGKLKFVELAEQNCEERHRYNPEDQTPITEADLAGLRLTIESEKNKFRKRLESWWKRYGAKGIKTWTYLQD